MGMLSERLPETVFVGGEEVAIETDFRTSILFEELLHDKELNDYQKICQAVELYYGRGVIDWKDRTEALDKIIWFYKGASNTHKKENEADSDVDDSTPLYSFDYDAERIYAAFLHDYNIDLQNISYLHWWKFKALFKGLSDENEIVKIIGYRGMTIDSKLSPSQQEYYRKMKRVYALPVDDAEQEMRDEIENLLMNGGSLREFLERNGNG